MRNCVGRLGTTALVGLAISGSALPSTCSAHGLLGCLLKGTSSPLPRALALALAMA